MIRLIYKVMTNSPLKVTLDTGCINIYENEELEQIFNMAEEGKIHIYYSDAAIHDIIEGNKDISEIDDKKRRKSAKKRLSRLEYLREVKSGFKFSYPYNTFPITFSNPKLENQIEDIIFNESDKDVDEEDVRHLVAHKRNENDFFITKNTNDFIKNSKREKLEELDIKVMTPSEFLDYMKNKTY